MAELVAAGLTNREIATTLHLSPRTVEHHVSGALRKLGVPSRQGLAAQWSGLAAAQTRNRAARGHNTPRTGVNWVSVTPGTRMGGRVPNT